MDDNHFELVVKFLGEENNPVKGGRGHANFVNHCKLCGRHNSLDILKDSILPYMMQDNNTFKTLVKFDCRGLEPTDFSPRVGFSAEGFETGTKFPEVNLTEKEWAEYDENAQEAVGIYEVTHQFIKL